MRIMTRNLLDKRMKLLRSELAEMGSLVEKQIYNSIEGCGYPVYPENAGTQLHQHNGNLYPCVQ